MDLISRFAAQRAAFEVAYESDDWAPLGEFLDEQISYEVVNMPFHCIVSGREAVLNGFQRSVARFDRLCRRTVGIDSSIRQEGDKVLVNAGIRFERSGAPTIEVRLWEVASYSDGRMTRLIDIYDRDDRERFEVWMTAWGEGLDPRYAES